MLLVPPSLGDYPPAVYPRVCRESSYWYSAPVAEMQRVVAVVARSRGYSLEVMHNDIVPSK
uniref:Uncharacterized protein n=1 Tax=Peronospora matthiolae TaxID=2874970 RepID=A0AAV1TNR4_9STRA